MQAEGIDDIKKDKCVGHFLNYLESERNASPHTVSGYLLDIAQFARFSAGDKGMAAFRWDEVDNFAARKFLVGFQKSGSQATTTGRKLSSLRTFYRFLEREGYVDSNPFSGLRAPKKSRNLPEILSVAEVGRLLEAPAKAAKKPARGQAKSGGVEAYAVLRDTALLEVLYSTGARVSEIVNLFEGDIDILSGVIKVKGKGKKERLAPLGGPAGRALSACGDFDRGRSRGGTDPKRALWLSLAACAYWQNGMRFGMNRPRWRLCGSYLARTIFCALVSSPQRRKDT